MTQSLFLVVLGALGLFYVLTIAPEEAVWIVGALVAFYAPISSIALDLARSADVSADLAKLTKERLAPRAEQRKP